MLVPFPQKQQTLPECEAFMGVDVALAYAVRDVQMAEATFMDEIVNCTTVDQAMKLKDVIEERALCMWALVSSALDRADRLSGKVGV